MCALELLVPVVLGIRQADARPCTATAEDLDESALDSEVQGMVDDHRTIGVDGDLLPVHDEITELQTEGLTTRVVLPLVLLVHLAAELAHHCVVGARHDLLMIQTLTRRPPLLAASGVLVRAATLGLLAPLVSLVRKGRCVMCHYGSQSVGSDLTSFSEAGAYGRALRIGMLYHFIFTRSNKKHPLMGVEAVWD